jgi:hypothetical protein
MFKLSDKNYPEWVTLKYRYVLNQNFETHIL